MKEVKDIQFPIQVITNIHYVNLHEDTQDLNPRLEKFIRNTKYAISNLEENDKEEMHIEEYEVKEPWRLGRDPDLKK